MDIGNKTLADFMNDTTAQRPQGTALSSSARAVFSTHPEIFYSAFWQIFSKVIPQNVYNTETHRAADLVRICELIDAGNLVVQNYLDQNYPASGATEGTQGAAQVGAQDSGVRSVDSAHKATGSHKKTA